MKAYILFFFLLFTAAASAQTNINNYKYVIVPEKFDFLKENNQYGLNTAAKLLLEEKGFTALLSNEELPAEVAANKCNALTTEVTQKKGLFVTNLTLLLKDCQGNVIFKSKEGKSREKEYITAYQLALRDAFTSLNDVPYKYDGTTFTQAQPAQTSPAAAIPRSTPPAAPTNAPASAPASPAVPVAAEAAGTLYAQSTPNGYQLIDTTPKKILTLLKTSLQDYFIAEGEGASGIVFKRNGEWFFEHYKDNKLVSQQLRIKF
jgi:hypothetical protein